VPAAEAEEVREEDDEGEGRRQGDWVRRGEDKVVEEAAPCGDLEGGDDRIRGGGGDGVGD
jgi:hypothetical protein